jgi:hypothetical protein
VGPHECGERRLVAGSELGDQFLVVAHGAER